MEQLQNLLKVNCHKLLNIIDYDNWVRQYFQIPFPSYWQHVFKIANSIPRESRVLEIGAGYGMITSIFVYLGYPNILSYEEDATVATLGNLFMDKVFGRRDIIKPSKFNTQSH